VQFRQEATREQAFEKLVRAYQQPLYRHIRRMVIDHEDADDLLQNVFIKVWQHLAGFRQDARLSTWLYRIATNEVLSFFRTRKNKYYYTMEDAESMLSAKIDKGELMDADELEKHLQKAILTLPEKQRLVFHMKYYEEMKYEDISEILGTSVGALKASYHHAVKKIQHYMENIT
jgi:RNA polymerase sigma-70 factor (ECF subfamily)